MNGTKLITSFLLFVFLAVSAASQNMLREIMRDPPPAFIAAMEGDDHPGAKMLAPGLFNHVRPYFEVYSADRDQFAGTIEGDLYLRNENSEEYVKRLKPKEGWYWHIDNAMWSPNGNYIIAKQVNDEGVPVIELSHDSPTEISYKTYSRAGEKIPIHQFYIIDTETWQMVMVNQNAEHPYVHVMDWHSNNEHVFLVESDRLMKGISLLQVAVQTGESTVLLHETSDTYLIGLDLLHGNSRRLLDRGLVTFLQDREQFIWLSERSGFYQMYLYDYAGNLIRVLTNGIFDHIVDVDLENDWLYYTAQSDASKTYDMQVYRSSIVANDIQQISDTEAVVDAFVSAAKDSILVLRSALPALIQMEAYTMDGTALGTIWKGDVSSIENGFFNVEYPSVLAADMKTQIEALILKPRDFDPTEKYPVVEYIYGGNFTNVVIRDLLARNLWNMQDLANSGFIVVFIDGRGTPKRGQAFRDLSYGRFGQVELQDHIAALRQIGEDRPYLDMDRIGILGHSWGGHFALRALLEAPDFYKAGHINAAGFDPVDFRVAIEAFMGCLPQDCPDKYEQSSISNKLSNLKAPLMMVHGTADDDVPIDESYKLVARLKELKYTNYQFIAYQGADHIVMRHPEWKPTMINFFVEHLK